MASAGDVNGDGLADLLIGAFTSGPSGRTEAGGGYVVFGQTATQTIDLAAVASGRGGFLIQGQSAFDWSGFSVSGAGDLNGDGLADLLVGAPRADTASGFSVGRSYVIYGKTDGSPVDLALVMRVALAFPRRVMSTAMVLRICWWGRPSRPPPPGLALDAPT